MRKKIILLIGIIISISSIFFTFIYYKSNNRLTIYAFDNSYAYKYAKKNMINTFNVSDSHYNYFHRIWEDFKFNEDNGDLIITKYEGISEELIIPTSYNNKKIIKIEKDALPSNVRKVFLPDTVKTIEEDDFSNIEILCYRGKYCEDLKSNDKLTVKVLDDVDRYKLNEENLEFTYNINNSEIELTNYLGNEETVIIPETINGYKVTSIKFDGEGIISIFIPKTVTSISGNITSKLFNKCLIISFIIIIISLIVYCASLLLTKPFELVDKVYIYFTSITYLFIVNYLVYVIRNNPFEITKYLIYSIIASTVYLIIINILCVIIKDNKKFDNDIKHKNDFIKDVLLLLQDYDYDELKEICEIIKYSDPVSISDVQEIEEKIKTEIKCINDNNVKEKSINIKKLITKRNTIIKNNK